MRKNTILTALLLIGACTADAKPHPRPTPTPTPRPSPSPTPPPSPTPALASANITWSASERATGYRLYFGRASRNYPQIITVNGTTYRVSGLTRGVRYYFAVKAVNGATSSAYSPEKAYTPL